MHKGVSGVARAYLTPKRGRGGGPSLAGFSWRIRSSCTAITGTQRTTHTLVVSYIRSSCSHRHRYKASCCRPVQYEHPYPEQHNRACGPFERDNALGLDSVGTPTLSSATSQEAQGEGHSPRRYSPGTSCIRAQGDPGTRNNNGMVSHLLLYFPCISLHAAAPYRDSTEGFHTGTVLARAPQEHQTTGAASEARPSARGQKPISREASERHKEALSLPPDSSPMP